MDAIKLARCALFAAGMALCAWIAIPLPPVPITLQSFALLLCLQLLGGKYGSITCLVYLLLGALGVPVFSGFRGGLGALLGPTGGYLLGFLLTALCYWAITARLGSRLPVRIAAGCVGLLLCYGFGTVWVLIYTAGAGTVSIWTALGQYVLPFLLPDALKLAAAVSLAQRLRRFV